MFKIFHLKRLILICLIIIFVFFIFLYYKKNIFGNNIFKNRMDKILYNLQNYETDMDVEIISNKNTNNYIMHQNVKENMCIQEIFDEKNEEVLKIKYENKNLEILNDKLNLAKVYQNFDNLINNSLFLSDFADEYCNSNDKNLYEKDGKIYIEINLDNDNTYSKYEILEIDKETLKPKELKIKDENKNTVIIIKYTNMEIN